ncbi:L-histidine N(alpha)-methyltransferase [Candidatus Methylomicrobium oryzae]|jgi:dimethylhistidine N-methyltransferase|uniref:L-histidine N(alpha)-methyltransferase n=1 Tax=Candidatus Methylomicrobium oryzae TaxID=2802053 RepID=UPI001F030833|nr:L-histidine N(alpha)-methyltransferase [Methylomicrobium sp. RS1]
MTMVGLHFYDFHPPLSDFQAEILAGLSGRQKTIAPKFFYDAQGSQLFDRICELPEYYLTRTETGLLERYGDQIADAVGPDAVLFELGSGSSRKIRLLLDALRPASYVPIDISKHHLRVAANALSSDYPWLEIHAVCADYAGALHLPSGLEGQRRIVFFPGSSIGNLTPEEAAALLKRIARLVGDGGGLLIGVDLVKDIDVLEAAYNDRQKVTEAFNKNLLVRINRELAADFRIDRFDHLAFYNPELDRIEMHLASPEAQSVRVADRAIRMAAGETIHTENSHKYSIASFHRLALRAGFRPGKVWIDPEGLFSIHYLSA